MPQHRNNVVAALRKVVADIPQDLYHITDFYNLGSISNGGLDTTPDPLGLGRGDFERASAGKIFLTDKNGIDFGKPF